MLERAKAAWGDIDAWLTLSADLLISLVVLQGQMVDLVGRRLSWIAVVTPLVVVNVAGALLARRRGLVALPFGPNTVFVVAFGAVLHRLNQGWAAQGEDAAARLVHTQGLTASALVIHGVVVLGVTLAVLWARPSLSRRALIVPLAAIGACYLVLSPLVRVAHEAPAVWLGAALLFVLMLARFSSGVAMLVALAAAAALGALGGTAPAATLTLADGVADPLPFLASAELWREAVPVFIVVSFANAFSVLENVAAATELGDRHDARGALGLVTFGTAIGLATGAAAPMTVYVGQPAYKQRGATWLYTLLAALTFVALAAGPAEGLIALVPLAVLYGAVAFVGVRVAALPRRFLKDRRDLGRALVAASPIVIGWAASALDLPEWLKQLSHGSGLIAVGWSFVLLGDDDRREARAACIALALATVGGLVHAPPLSLTGAAIAACYLGLALLSSRPKGA